MPLFFHRQKSVFLMKRLKIYVSFFQIYQNAFEKKFLEASDRLYRAEGQRLMEERDVSSHCAHVGNGEILLQF